ncbi:uncharacterized protein SCHCODRAFT_02627394 [Schizophyllum commune H4-8]|nr:uncharacterized protein SCHCODRAFT_02627394 [Schizophyllum commune H4-8]KAI5892885.1 hypothetical protein SCHCODRAFT_02627394 [Schizophyllum commune H4-8]
MGQPLRAVDAVFIGAFMSTLLFGAYLAVAYECTRVVNRRRKHRVTHKFLVGTHLVLFILTCLRCITVLTRAMLAIRFHMLPDGGVDMGALSSAPSMLINVVWFLAVIVSDAFIICRVAVVWRGRMHIVAIPMLGWLANTASGIYMLHVMKLYGPGADGLQGPLVGANVAFCVTTLSTNLISSCLIAFRIWSVRRSVQYLTSGAHSVVNNLLAAILESAALYSTLLVLHIIFVATGSQLMLICVDMEAPTIGIVFSSIIIRVSEGRAHGNTSDGAPTSGEPSSGPRSRTWTSIDRGVPHSGNIDVAIRLETVTHRDHENVAELSPGVKGKEGGEGIDSFQNPRHCI